MKALEATFCFQCFNQSESYNFRISVDHHAKLKQYLIQILGCQRGHLWMRSLEAGEGPDGSQIQDRVQPPDSESEHATSDLSLPTRVRSLSIEPRQSDEENPT